MLIDCFRGVYQALLNGFFNFESFDVMEYEHYEKVENGDFNWIVPKKFLAFCGPHSHFHVENGYTCFTPEMYVSYFHSHNVTDVIRLNNKVYNASRFTNAGIAHHDLYFIDGSVPTDAILRRFLHICEMASGAVAVHCKAGLGRTGTLIGCYLMKHYLMSAAEAIAWIRVARPGSILGPQQHFMEEKQSSLWVEGQRIRDQQQQNATCDSAHTISCLTTIVDDLCLDDNMNSEIQQQEEDEDGQKNCTDENVCVNVVEQLVNDSDEEDSSVEQVTQGDLLNRQKLNRTQQRQQWRRHWGKPQHNDIDHITSCRVMSGRVTRSVAVQ
jgi:cell division cycle 14